MSGKYQVVKTILVEVLDRNKLLIVHLLIYNTCSSPFVDGKHVKESRCHKSFPELLVFFSKFEACPIKLNKIFSRQGETDFWIFLHLPANLNINQV
jgi:hypothetical protein